MGSLKAPSPPKLLPLFKGGRFGLGSSPVYTMQAAQGFPFMMPGGPFVGQGVPFFGQPGFGQPGFNMGSLQAPTPPKLLPLLKGGRFGLGSSPVYTINNPFAGFGSPFFAPNSGSSSVNVVSPSTNSDSSVVSPSNTDSVINNNNNISGGAPVTPSVAANISADNEVSEGIAINTNNPNANASGAAGQV